VVSVEEGEMRLITAADSTAEVWAAVVSAAMVSVAVVSTAVVSATGAEEVVVEE
jgi:hypothetical protein